MATINGVTLTPGELAVYMRAAARARLAYKRKHGTTAVPVPAGYRIGGTGATAWEWRDDAARLEVSAELAARDAAWQAEHGQAYAAAAHRAGVSAVKRMHTGYAADVRHAAASLERLEVLGMTGRRSTRKPAAAPAPVEVVEVPAAPVLRKTSKLVTCGGHASFYASHRGARRFVAVVEGGAGTACTDGRCVLTPGTDHYAADLVAGGPVDVMALNGTAELEPVAEVAPVEVVADVVPIRAELERVEVPATVPAPMPAMTRAARRASNRELAERMRAAGLTPAGDAWRLATGGVPLEDIARKLAELKPAGL